MKKSEFIELTKTAKPISIDFKDGYSIEILFDNGTSVEVDIEVEFDSPHFTFESNIEVEGRKLAQEKAFKAEKERKRLFEEQRLSIRLKYTDEQWAELEQAFLYNNGMTFEQNKALRKQHDEILGSIIEKYGYDKEGKSNWNSVNEILK